jgi:hypothetical protein
LHLVDCTLRMSLIKSFSYFRDENQLIKYGADDSEDWH